MTSVYSSNPKPQTRRQVPLWVFDLLLVLILVLGTYFRTVGVNWDQNEHLHPDERFLTMVESGMRPVDSLSEYFDTRRSTLNPHNLGYTFFVYGTLPMIVVRYAAEWLGQVGYDQVHLVGRQLSAIADLLTVFMVYLIGARLYNRRVALLAAAFSAFAVLQIQLSHYFTVDTFANLFTFVAFYFAARVMTDRSRGSNPREGEVETDNLLPLPEERVVSESEARQMWIRDDPVAAQVESERDSTLPQPLPGREGRQSLLPVREGGWRQGIHFKIGWSYLLFGAAAGMALASKILVFPVVFLLPLAAAVFLSRLDDEERRRQYLPVLVNLAFAGLMALLFFRIFQPYAFSGPGFFGLKPNPLWVENIREQRLQGSADSDAPFALQWARRPLWFAGYNLVVFGLGIPLGLLAFAGVLFMGWRILKGEWRPHLMLWGWTVAYFTWQSVEWVRSMRYQILVYPTLAIIAAWVIVYGWDSGRRRLSEGRRGGVPLRMLAFGFGGVVLVLTFLWAYAFTRIYTRPVTRVAASEWVYQNVRAPINLKVEGENGTRNQPLAYEMGAHVSPGYPYELAFTSDSDGVLMDVTLPAVFDETFSEEEKFLLISISEADQPGLALGTAAIRDVFNGGGMGSRYTASLDAPLPLQAGKNYLLTIDLPGTDSSLYITGAPQLSALLPADGQTTRQTLPVIAKQVSSPQPFVASYLVYETGTVREITFPHLVDQWSAPGQKTLRLTFSGPDALSGEQFSVTSEVTADFLAQADEPRGQGYTFTLSEPVRVKARQPYTLVLEVVQGDAALAAYGSWTAIETPWDDPIPLPLNKYAPFDQRSGFYRGDLNFEMYITDSPEKRERMLQILDQSDYIFFTSNRQYGTTTRVPERYPMTSEYYRKLLGCPNTREVIWCYNMAEPGMFIGGLGYDLVEVYQSDPNLGSLRFNTQFAEEAFTVYDHPKVMIFRKTESYDPAKVRETLEAVDLSNVVHVTPRRASANYTNLMLPAARLQGQQSGGTWRELFDTSSLINTSQPVTVAVWYLAVLMLGWVVYPLVRLALPGLSDRGYPLAKTAALVVLAWLVWMGGSLGISVSRMMITQVIAVLVLLGASLAFVTRENLGKEIRARGGYYLTIELLGLLFFAGMLLIRIGNPDLWHPAHGGERPMEFSYLNAILKSTTFPPYDPWWAGGYINYYYYGYVIVGVLVKWLGIIPAWAFNLILPTLFSLLALGVFSVVWNLRVGRQTFWPVEDAPTDAELVEDEEGLDDSEDEELLEEDGEPDGKPVSLPWVVCQSPFLMGLAGAIGMVVLGNLGTVRMIWYGLQRLAAPGGQIDGANIFNRIQWTIQGLGVYARTLDLGYGWGDWYWIPSRVIPSPGGNEITEFPMFTFLYADLHPHMIALPLTVLALAWMVSLVLSHGLWGLGLNRRNARLSLAASFILGGLTIGALRPTNTWDFPTYLALAVIALAYTAWFHFEPPDGWLPGWPVWLRKAAAFAAGAVLLVGLALLLYQPFSAWYRQPYNQFEPWEQAKTPFWSYLTHWGVFLFLITSWLVWETRQWLASTPMSALNKLRPYMGWIQIGLAALLAGIALLLYLGVQVGWLIAVLGIWTVVLLARPGVPETKRLALFMVGSGLALTLFVELLVLRGDIGRMNTIFKFYLQAWTLFSIAAICGLGWVIEGLRSWRPRWLPVWQVAAVLLVAGAALFPLYGIRDKLRNRWYPDAPKGLDGMAYMENASYHFSWDPMDLGQDYRAIRWLQDNVQGSPVIVEANLRELYRWGSRMTIYTGLPGVAGWEWHQVQQRGFLAQGMVTNRILEIEEFYRTTDPDIARRFLQKYNIGYIIVGQQERGLYAGPGLDKFPQQEGVLWQRVYADGATVIYQSSCSCFPVPEAGD